MMPGMGFIEDALKQSREMEKANRTWREEVIRVLDKIEKRLDAIEKEVTK